MSAFAAESDIKTARSQTSINVAHGRSVNVTFTLKRTDKVYMRFRGSEQLMGTGAFFISSARNVTNLGDGKYRVVVEQQGYRELNGSAIVLRSRTGALIDSDQIVTP